MSGRLLAGTSGFSYPGWAPAFYPAGLPAGRFLAHYATILDACELNGTYYRRPSPGAVQGWLGSTPSGFRFTLKAQRGGSLRALLTDPGEAVPWLTQPLAAFGDRLGAVLFRVPEGVTRDEGRLRALLAEWPSSIPLTLELRDPSWHVDEVHALLRSAGAVLCATELPEDPSPPAILVTGPFLYLRLRRHAYTRAEIGEWAARIAPFLEVGHDVYAFFRHDEHGAGPSHAVALRDAVRELVDPSPRSHAAAPALPRSS